MGMVPSWSLGKTAMNYTNIVLAIPHSVGQLTCRCPNPKVNALRLQFTDWFTDELFSIDDPGVAAIKCPLSRLEVDAERLEHEEDRLCNFAILSGNAVAHSIWNRSLAAWFKYRADLLEATAAGERPLIIDCHSYPQGIGDDIDICLGFNEDASRPSDATLESVAGLFRKNGYAVGINTPYSNAIAPVGYRGHSLMIEINKRCYMDEARLEKTEGFVRLHDILASLYRMLRASFPAMRRKGRRLAGNHANVSASRPQ